MRCSEFLELYSDYRDGLLADAATARAMSDHLAACSRCTRYNARLARGVTLLRSLSDLEPSPDFHRTLAHRLSQPAAAPAPARSAAVLAAVMVLTAMATVAWGLRGYLSQPARTAPTEVRAVPPPAIIANPAPPFVAFAELEVPAFDAQWHSPIHTEAARTALLGTGP